MVFAYILTRSRFFNEILEQHFSRQNRLILVLVCGLFSIYGTISGMEVLGGIANIRDLGPAIAGRELFSEERLTRAAEGINSLPASEGVSSIHDAVTRFSAGAPQSDDITLLLLRYKGGVKP